jgi:hypothetical protein
MEYKEMAKAKQRPESHLIDQEGERLLRSKLPKHWVMREYRPDYGIDFTVEVFKSVENTFETLGEHFFIQLKSIATPKVKKLKIFGRQNVERSYEDLNLADKIADIEVYSFSLETSELVTVERMGIAVPMLLVIADLATQRCFFVCLNDYIDKILIPRHKNYSVKKTRTIDIPLYNEIGTSYGLVALRWYAKRPKYIAAFQRFTYQYSQLQLEERDWRGLAEVFAAKIANYDFWNDTPIKLIEENGLRLQHFIKTGQPGLLNKLATKRFPEFERLEVLDFWRHLSLLPNIYEDILREYFLPTALGCALPYETKFKLGYCDSWELLGNIDEPETLLNS